MQSQINKALNIFMELCHPNQLIENVYMIYIKSSFHFSYMNQSDFLMKFQIPISGMVELQEIGQNYL